MRLPIEPEWEAVARRLGPDRDRDLGILIDALIAPVVGDAGLREGQEATVSQAWRRGGALLCLDGLDEVAGTPATPGAPSRRERLAAAISRLGVLAADFNPPA